ncbi:DUF4164 family protein [Hyphobacterium marinum]|uniref:DUF4164 family protein n=1 Tax=Hyphobacterium marinum TaxID=3116574 RepID=A0ABU7LY13_9PROT|nr:DUF4164 family protein [Hyphobacterium sp. Y6023]MEE2566433.1 DUF4164 family protein [Hyphobacterium sp. Y6023]
MTESTADPVAEATERLNRALSRVEIAVGRLRDRVTSAGHSDSDRARLAEELDEARAREEALTEAANDASKALALAIADLREAAQAADDAADTERDADG